MALPPGYALTVLKNAAVAEPICETTANSWIAGYKYGQNLHIEVDVPDASPGAVYGLNQTQLLAIRTGIYEDKDNLIQLWRTPPQVGRFNFKGSWLDSESSDSNDPTFPYQGEEAVAKAIPRNGHADGRDGYYVSLRMSKSPQVEMPTHIQKKSNPEEKLKLHQLDVQEMYLLTLFRDDDLKQGKKIPIVQWNWEYKYAWEAGEDGKPTKPPVPGLAWAEECIQRNDQWHNFNVRGAPLASGQQHDHFLKLDPNMAPGPIGEVEDWVQPQTDEWEACSM